MKNQLHSLAAALAALFADTMPGEEPFNPKNDPHQLHHLVDSSGIAPVSNARKGPAAKIPWQAADFLTVNAGGEWNDRRELMRREVLTWYPTSQGIRKTGSSGPLDFNKDILALWTPQGRIPAAGLSGHPQSYTGLGKTLVALVDYAADGKSPALTAEKDRIVGTILNSQDGDGYLGIGMKNPADPAAVLWQAWNLHDAAYLCLGLIENFRYFHHRPSLDAARRYADFVIANWPSAPEKPGRLSPIGFSEMLLALSESTGDPKYRLFAARTPMDGRFIEFASLKDWRQELYPMSDEKSAGAGGAADAAAAKFKAKVHSYRYFARLLEQLRLHRADPDDGLFAMTRYTEEKTADPDSPGVFITGANTRREGWVEDQQGIGTIGEGCAVVHMAWWRGKLIEADGDLSHGDFIERAVFNHLEASQDPHSGQTRYDCMLSGERNFHKGAHCCDGNHKRFWARIGDLVFYRFTGGIAVDQFSSASAALEVDGKPVRITMETDYPATGAIKLEVALGKPSVFALRLRVPRWAQSHTLTVNGGPCEATPVPGGMEIRREWKPGDTVMLELPMSFRWIKGLRFYDGHAALTRGPQVFALAASRNPALKDIENWRGIVVDPATVKLLPAPSADGARRPIEASAMTKDGVPLVFSDFPVPDGRETYVRLADPGAAVGDPLFEEADGRTARPPVSAGSGK
jgi:DUF1680 family protein